MPTSKARKSDLRSPCAADPRATRLLLELVRQRRLAVAVRSKDLQEGEESLDLQAGQIGKVSFPVEWGSYRLEVKGPDDVVSSVRFWAGYSWQDNSEGAGAARPDRVTMKLDKPSYKPGDTIRLHIAAPAAGKGYAMVESSEGPLWWQEIDVPAEGMDLSIPVDNRIATTSTSARWWFVPAINRARQRRNARWACCICRWAMKTVA